MRVPCATRISLTLQPFCGRWQGLDRGPIVPVEYFRAHLRPLDVAGAKDAIREAITLGFSREEERERRVRDLGLEELQKKTAKAE